MARRLRQEAGTDLGPSQVAALATVERHGPLSPSELADRERIKRPTATRIVSHLEAAGLVASGTSPDERLVEVIELPEHPFFVASQFHPEFKSRPERPAPLFREFVRAALTRAEPAQAEASDSERIRA